ncbi:MAG: hypothetical protein CFH10_01809 [Alphaproteobacteria bacterium MarineAlpha4_Bin2]|nr:MAG: hypothetical protein CFH10_01809 [Alphaproteobacteria bacterium MarineAlpha4_Bin2]
MHATPVIIEVNQEEPEIERKSVYSKEQRLTFIAGMKLNLGPDAQYRLSQLSLSAFQNSEFAAFLIHLEESGFRLAFTQ